MLIIGAGSGNDVSRALQWGAKHVDAVEIDPLIQRLGRDHHPDHPYQDPRVEVQPDDGRNFLHSTERKYDLIIYALVDSLVLHSSYSNIRLESYLFTTQAFEDVRRHLKPDGLFVMYNFFRQGWIAVRLDEQLESVFGAGNPIAFCLPYRSDIGPDDALHNHFMVFISGATGPIRQAFEAHKAYWLPADRPPGLDSPDGFREQPSSGVWARFGPAHLHPPAEPLHLATDDWPFLYLRKPMIPTHILVGGLIMGGLAVALLLLFMPRLRVKRIAGRSTRACSFSARASC